MKLLKAGNAFLGQALDLPKANHPMTPLTHLRAKFHLRCVSNRVLIAALLAWVSWCSSAADIDSIREPVIRPNEETVRRWLYNFEIVVEKRTFWTDRKAKIEPSKILNMTTSGGSIYQKPPPWANYAITTRTFEYPDGKGKTNKYVVVIEYEWSSSFPFTSVDRKFLKVASVIGP